MGAFSDVDRVVVTDVYAASEDPIEGVNSLAFTNELKEKLRFLAKIFLVTSKKLRKNYSRH